MPADPTPENGYALHPDHRLSVALWTLILSSLHGRLSALETVAGDWDEALGEQSTELAQGILDNTVVPQFEAVQAAITELVEQLSMAGDQLASIQAGAVLAANVHLSPIEGLVAQTLQAALAEHQGKIAAATTGLAAHLAAKATLVDANTGTSNTRWMTALRTRQARMARRLTFDGPGSIQPADFGREINCISQSFTLALTAAGTMGDGWYCWVRNSSTANVVTLDPAGAEMIDGMATLRLYPGEAFLITCDGVAWHSVGRLKSLTLGSVTIGSPAATVEFTLGIDDPEFVALSIEGWRVRHNGADAEAVWLRLREAGTWIDAGYSAHFGGVFGEGPATETVALPVTSGLPNGDLADFAIELRGAASTERTSAAGRSLVADALTCTAGQLAGIRTAGAVATGLRLMLDDTGSFDAGIIRLTARRA